VIRYLNQHFVPVQLNQKEWAQLARTYSVAWTPTLIVEHHRGAQVRAWIGYLAPDQFLPELELAHAQHALRSAQPGQARRQLRALRTHHPEAFAVPEAIYWEGVAAYRESGDKEPMWETWRELVRGFPDSPWTMRTTLLEEDGPTHRER
jgi:hypothetical protein